MLGMSKKASGLRFTLSVGKLKAISILFIAWRQKKGFTISLSTKMANIRWCFPMIAPHCMTGMSYTGHANAEEMFKLESNKVEKI